MNTLIKLQKRAVRLIFSAKRYSHTEKAFKLANILAIEKLYEKEDTKFVHKFISDKSSHQHCYPKAISDILFKENDNVRRARMYDDETTIKIHHDYLTLFGLASGMTLWTGGGGAIMARI